MTYCFTLTPRLLFVATASLIALLALLFFLGIEIGRQLAAPEAGALAGTVAHEAGNGLAAALPPPPALPASPLAAAPAAH
ncbi:hypothetical protein [Derxia lacustris]|uniref:hypothetical protein n=1 Tax=Derxia lacustris TaxID=764842 RepID=UPI000A170DB2|nr:hypothetical protein [Derxia lacustris]